VKTFTLDTNCIIDLAENRPAAPHIRALVAAHTTGKADIALVAVSASERQKGDFYLDSFEVFRERLTALGLSKLTLLKGIGYSGISYWGMCIYSSDATSAREKEIHDVLFPNIPFKWTDHANANSLNVESVKAPEGRKWRNAFCDRQMYWAHDHNNRQYFVTSDDGFRRLLGHALFQNAKVVTPEEAAALI
jgi:hypothetical protein